MYTEPQEQALARFSAWANAHNDVRALILTSTRAIPNARLDAFSDYDLILYVNDVRPYHEQRDWLSAFGSVLVMYNDPLTRDGEFETSGNIVQFEDGLKIDFTLQPVGMLQRLAQLPELPDEFDAGYRVLVDKDGLTAALKPPSYRAYIPKPPSEREFRENVEVFFVDAIYVAKYLWRDDRIAAKEVFDHYLKQDHLLPLLVWRAEIDHGWAKKPGVLGRGLKRWLRPDLWAALETTYTGADAAANWDALFRAIALFRRVGVEVGDLLGYAYPHDLHERALAYIHKVRQFPTDGGEAL